MGKFHESREEVSPRQRDCKHLRIHGYVIDVFYNERWACRDTPSKTFDHGDTAYNHVSRNCSQACLDDDVLQILLSGNVTGEPPSICRETNISRVECNLTFAWGESSTFYTCLLDYNRLFHTDVDQRRGSHLSVRVEFPSTRSFLIA